MMGDEADRLIDEGMDGWMLHQSGMCDAVDPCQYCEDEEKERERKKRRATKLRKKRKRRGLQSR